MQSPEPFDLTARTRMRVLQPFAEAYLSWARLLPRVRGRGLILRSIDALQRLGVAAPIVVGELGTRLELGTDFVSRDVFYTGKWEPQETALLASITPAGGTFIDVGANVGYFSLLASRWVGSTGRVFSFEPSENTFARLQRNLALNDASNITTYAMGCAATAGSAMLVHESDPGLAHIELDATHGRSDAESIPLTTLDEFVRSQALDRVDVIKIDVEGADFEVLKGARETLTRFHPTVLLEVEHLARFGQSTADVTAFMEPLGYRCDVLQHESASDMLCRYTAG